MFNISRLQNSLVNGNNVSSTKFFVSTCQSQVNATLQLGNPISWMEVESTLKLTQDYDKSRVIKAKVQQQGSVIVKLGNIAIEKEYEIGEKLKYKRGFIRFVCHFKCDDDYLEHPGSRKSLCKGVGNKMHVIVMPFMAIGSIADYLWNANNIDMFRSLVKQTILTIISTYVDTGFVHGDLHAKNVLIKQTNYENVHYQVNNNRYTIPTAKHVPIIMDFENSTFASQRDMFAKQTFFMDLNKFFVTLNTFIKGIDTSKVFPISNLISNVAMRMGDAQDLLPMVDLIDDLVIM